MDRFNAMKVFMRVVESHSFVKGALFPLARHLPRKVRVFSDWVADLVRGAPMMQAPEPEANHSGFH